MNNLFDPRDRTPEFHVTLTSLKNQRAAANINGNTNGINSSSSTTHRLAPKHPTTDENQLNSPGLRTLNNSRTASHAHTAENGNSARDPLLTASSASEPRALFNQMARQIGEKIRDTTTKLEQLANIVKNDRSMFNDATASINALAADIRDSLSDAQSAIQKLAEIQRQTLANSQTDRTWAMHSRTMVSQTQGMLKSTHEQFAQLLKERTNIVKDVNQRRKQFDGNSTSAPLRKRAGNAFGELMAIADESSQAAASGANAASSVSFSLSSSQLQEQAQVVAPPQDTYYEARAAAVEQIETVIGQIAGMYKELSNLVQEQGEVAVRIDNNLDNTLEHVEGGQAELLKYFDRISSSRWLVIKIFAVLIAFIIFFMVFVA